MKMIEVVQDEEGMIFIATDGGEPKEVESPEAAAQMLMEMLSGGAVEEDMTEEAQMKTAMAAENEEFAGGFSKVRGAGL